jgi:3-deoxy-D-manno-octulosonic-acid transferase
MLIAIYSLLLALVLVLSAPVWLWRMAATGRYREGLAERLGFVSNSLRAAVEGKKVVWVHAVSVGETLAAERMITELQQMLPGYVIAISTTTATGQKLARERFAGCPVFFYPLDFAFAVRAYLRVLRPSLLVLVESEFWPRMLVECERGRVPVAVVNARVSDRSFPRSMRLRLLWRPLLGKISLFLAQSEESAERLRQIGAPAGRVRVSGNLKYDAPDSISGGGSNTMTSRIGGLLRKSRLLIAGSTHEGEEQAVLAAWPTIRHAMPDVALLIAPRHPQRFDEVWGLIQATKAARYRCSHLQAGNEPVFGGTILLLDSIGDLASMYAIASAAFIGGSLVPRGGQNPLEAARYGVPVVMGNYVENFREIAAKMRAGGSLTIVEPEDLALALVDALRRGPSGPKPFEGQSGATQRTVEALVQWVEARA